MRPTILARLLLAVSITASGVLIRGRRLAQ
jgi:hypothetical protein